MNYLYIYRRQRLDSLVPLAHLRLAHLGTCRGGALRALLFLANLGTCRGGVLLALPAHLGT